jgi:hypothetical protein
MLRTEPKPGKASQDIYRETTDRALQCQSGEATVVCFDVLVTEGSRNYGLKVRLD